MSTPMWFLARIASGLVIAGAALAQNGPSLNGPYGFLAAAKQLDSAGQTGGAVLGVLNFDGSGNVSGTATVKARTGDANDGYTSPGAVSGTYTTNSDGTGSLALDFPDFGFSAKLAIAISEGGKSFVFADGPGSTNPAAYNPSLPGNFESFSGVLNNVFLLRGATATGSVPIKMNRTYNDTDNGVSVYALAAAANGGGTVTCPDGSTSTWSAIVSSATAVLSGTTGNFLLAVQTSACAGHQDFTNYSGTANIVLNANANGSPNLVFHVPGSFVPGSARAITGGGPSGSYAVQFTGEPVPNTFVGLLNFDGSGGVTAAFTTNATNLFSGTYTTNPDGTGTMTITSTTNPAATPNVYAFVATDGGSSLYLLRTSGGANGGDNVFGTARQQ